jgi:cyanophycin synthetase
MTVLTSPSVSSRLSLPQSINHWRSEVRSRGVPPVVAVAGSRGKSTVVHLLAAMLAAARVRAATWTDEGVRIVGRKQRGELLPWAKAMTMLADASLDVAIQELDWDTVHAVGLPPGSYPLVGVTNLCANSDACLLRAETLRAVRALGTIREAADPAAVLVLNGDDWAVAGGDLADDARNVLVTVSRETPLVRSHLNNGGHAAWIEEDALHFGTEDRTERLMAFSEIAMTRNGVVGFQTINTLVAVGLARSIGLATAHIVSALRSFEPEPERLPGSFNMVEVNGATIVVDRPAAPWFLRQPLRAIGHVAADRHLRLVGRLDGISDGELVEAGRLLGRSGGVVIVHDEVGSGRRRDLLLQGIAANDVPPVVVNAKSESAAMSALLRMLRSGDVVYVLADDPRYVLRRLSRAMKPGRTETAVDGAAQG